MNLYFVDAGHQDITIDIVGGFKITEPRNVFALVAARTRYEARKLFERAANTRGSGIEFGEYEPKISVITMIKGVEDTTPHVIDDEHPYWDQIDWDRTNYASTEESEV